MVQIGPKIKTAHNLLKFGTFDISNMSISILISKMIFVKYLPPVRPKLVPKLKVPQIYWNWHNWYFTYADLDFNVKNDYLSNIYQLLGLNFSQNEKCSKFIKFGWTDI